MTIKKDLYTFIVDYRSGTYIKQVSAISEVEAVRIWLTNLDYSVITGFGFNSYHKVCSLWNEEKKMSSLNEIHNVWCLTYTIRDQLFLVTIVKTAQ